jgi:hypothetical protein
VTGSTLSRPHKLSAIVGQPSGFIRVRYLLRLAELELIDRERRMVDRRIKAAKFPTVKSLDSFDFAALPSLNKALVMELARSEYVERRENIISRSATPAPERATSDWGWVLQPARKACRSVSRRPPPSCTN